MGRGLGLDLLKQFVCLNKGRLEFFSDYGHVYIDESRELYRVMPTFFEGTLVNISLVCDDTYYHLKSEMTDHPSF